MGKPCTNKPLHRNPNPWKSSQKVRNHVTDQWWISIRNWNTANQWIGPRIYSLMNSNDKKSPPHSFQPFNFIIKSPSTNSKNTPKTPSKNHEPHKPTIHSSRCINTSRSTNDNTPMINFAPHPILHIAFYSQPPPIQPQRSLPITLNASSQVHKYHLIRHEEPMSQFRDGCDRFPIAERRFWHPTTHLDHHQYKRLPGKFSNEDFLQRWRARSRHIDDNGIIDIQPETMYGGICYWITTHPEVWKNYAILRGNT